MFCLKTRLWRKIMTIRRIHHLKSSLIFPVILFLFICFSSVLAQTQEIITSASGDWNYIKNQNGITLTAWNRTAEELDIPSELDGEPVTALEKDLFKNHNELKRVFIPDSVTTIGSNAFNGCVNLTDVRLPSSLNRIENGVFRYCINLEHIDIPFSVTAVRAFAFADCLKLQDIFLLAVTSIGESAFDNCQSLSSVTLSRKVTSVDSYAFRDTPWLENQTDEFVIVGKGILIKWNGTGGDAQVPYGTTVISSAFSDNYLVESVTLPETVMQIGPNAFRDAINLNRINIPPYVTSIGASAFDGCRSLETIDLPKSIKELGGSAFQNCDVLKSLTIPQNITTIPSGLLVNCPELTDVIIPDSVTRIDIRAFQGSPNIRLHVAYGSEAERLLKENEIPYSYTLQETRDFIYSRDADGIRLLRYVGDLFEVEIPAEINGVPVVAVGAGAFQTNGRVRRVSVPLTIKTIDDWAFSYMDSLQAVQLTSGLDELGSNIFTGSSALREIRLPQNLKKAGDQLFDENAQTKICAAEDSNTAKLMREMGYEVQPEDACADDAELAALLAELKAAAPSADTCDCGPQQTGSAEAEKIEIVKIPADITILTAEMLENASRDLILVIPSRTAQIEEAVLEKHNIVTIISESGSAAESFAGDHGIKFLIRFELKLNMQ